MKKLIICLLLLGSFLFSENHERIKIPVNLKIEENGFNEILIKNLSEDEEIYYAIGITIIGENIFIGNAKPVEIVKLNLKGETVQRGGKEGRGPGEFVYCLCPKEVNNKLVFFDIHNKLIFYTTDLKFIKEFKHENEKVLKSSEIELLEEIKLKKTVGQIDQLTRILLI